MELLENQCMHKNQTIIQTETALDLRYNISALAIAICSDDYMLPEGAFSILGDKFFGTNDADVEDMITMRQQGMTYRAIGEIYGVNKDTVHNRIRRYRERKEKELSDCNLKSSMY